MNVFIIFAAVAALIGIGLFWWRKGVGRELKLMQGTPASVAADIGNMAPGSIAKLKGTLRSATPLTAEFSQKACIYYRAVIEREYDEEVTEVDNEQRTQTRTERRSETIRSQERYAPDAFIDDDSGKIALSFEGAKIEAIELHRRREPATAAVVELIRRYAPNDGSVTLFGKVFHLGHGGTVAYSYVETILPPDIPIYVLGTVLAGGMIGAHKSHTYVISHKSEEQRTKDLTSTRRWLTGFGVLFLVVAAGLAIWGLQ